MKNNYVALQIYKSYIDYYLTQNKIYQLQKKYPKINIDDACLKVKFLKIFSKKLQNITKEEFLLILSNVFDKMTMEEKSFLINFLQTVLYTNSSNNQKIEKDLFNEIENILIENDFKYNLQDIVLTSNNENIYNIALTVKQNGIENMTYDDFKYLFDTLNKKELLEIGILTEKDLVISNFILKELEQKGKNKHF